MPYDVYDPEQPGGPVRTTYLPANMVVFDPGEEGGGVLHVPEEVSIRDFVTTDDFKQGLETALEHGAALALEVAGTQQLNADDRQSIERIAAEHDQIVVVVWPDADS